MKRLLALSSSRKPPGRVRQLINEISLILPRSIKIQRGHLSLEELGRKAYTKSCSHIILVSSRHGNPSLLSGFEIKLKNEEFSINWCFDWIIQNVKLANELKIKRLQKRFTGLEFNAINIVSEIETIMNSFFDYSEKKVKSLNIDNRLVLEYNSPGFLFYPKVNSLNYSPKISISEIVVQDKSREGNNYDKNNHEY